MVLAVCRGLLREPAEAEDAAQQTFLSAQRALANGSEPQQPAAWLATIARHECGRRAQARRQRPPASDAEPSGSSPDSHTAAVRREHVAALRDAIGSLPEQQREAILLREFRGYSYDEVAATLAVSPSAVESLLFRARRGLQLRLRNAWGALSPLGLNLPLRDILGRVATGSGPAAAPVAAKAIAVGVGAAVVAGGAVVAPRLIDRTPTPHRPPARPTAAAAGLAVAPAQAHPTPRSGQVLTFVPTAIAHRKPARHSEHETLGEQGSRARPAPDDAAAAADPKAAGPNDASSSDSGPSTTEDTARSEQADSTAASGDSSPQSATTTVSGEAGDTSVGSGSDSSGSSTTSDD